MAWFTLMGNSGNFLPQEASPQLSSPLVKLVNSNTREGRDPVKVEADNAGNSYLLKRYPVVTAIDLTPDQIEKGVYVEMAHYRRGKSPYNINKNYSGYVVPAPQIAGANPLGDKWTRGGSHVGTADRPNHYRVTAQNEQIPVWEYLKNRHISRVIQYRDTAGAYQTVDLFVPNQRVRAFSGVPGKTFMYASAYRPYYFKFRYVMFDEEANNWVTGGWSRVIKLVHDQHPFSVDARQSAIIGAQVGTIHPQFNKDLMSCAFETRLP